MYCVYRHINKINGKQYIGCTKRQPKKRWGKDGKNYYNTPCFFEAIKEFGWENFEHEIIKEGLTKEQAYELERQLIKKYKTQDRQYGYNILEGGVATYLPQEVREKMSKSMKGNKNALGVEFTEERRRKISESLKGRSFSEEHKKNISKARKGKTHKPISAEARKKIADKHKKTPVYCEETQTTYESIQECARQLGFPASPICACCKGRFKSYKGYHFRYD